MVEVLMAVLHGNFHFSNYYLYLLVLFLFLSYGGLEAILSEFTDYAVNLRVPERLSGEGSQLALPHLSAFLVLARCFAWCHGALPGCEIP